MWGGYFYFHFLESWQGYGNSDNHQPDIVLWSVQIRTFDEELVEGSQKTCCKWSMSSFKRARSQYCLIVEETADNYSALI